ncbi:MAG: hypothetical protein E6R03_10700 [Hyphomicrobiaceae bacterium]|nr:MAG: hypothetical protein E6R03_10700 [Hyphomicrobiaceae bacterium]
MRLSKHEVIRVVYEGLQQSHPKTPVEPKELAEAFGHAYLVARNGLIERVGDRLYARWGLKAAAWLDDVVCRIDAVDSAFGDLWMSGDLDETDPEAVAMATCYGIAVLLFWRCEDRGWVEYAPTLSEEDAAAWLEQYAVPVHSDPRQPSLFEAWGAA